MRITASLAAIALAALVCCTSTPDAPDATSGLDGLRIMQGDYPRAFFFRGSEGLARNPEVSYEEWERTFNRLMGIMGKTLDEEVVKTQWRNVDFFTRFKQQHPEQAVLLHFNGNARDPRWERDEFFAGHWLYYNGSKITADVPAEAGEFDLAVENPALYKLNGGRYNRHHDDIGLCELDVNGKPDWSKSEQVQLVSVNAAAKTIRVLRGAYGTESRAFQAGKAYAASHVQEGPWGSESHLMWFYNFSTDCPRDAQGRNCSDVLVDDVSRRFEPGGHLAAFDGLEFDVLRYLVRPNGGPGRAVDTNADTEIDRGIIDGVNRYGIGVNEFCRQLRERFPQDKLLMADGMHVVNQRAFHILNGIESEGFPELRDLEMAEWSGGINRHLFWDRFARPPAFNYINHKFVVPSKIPGREPNRRPPVPFGVHRLSFAASVLTNAALCIGYPPQTKEGERISIWDEMVQGAANQLGWLGKPLAPAAHLAESQPDLLDGAGKSGDGLAKLLSGNDVETAADGAAVKITGMKTDGAEMRFRLNGVKTQGPDLFVKLTVSADPRRGYPAEMPRLLHVGVVGSSMKPIMSWAGQDKFDASFYFNSVEAGTVDLQFVVEGTEALRLSGLTVHAHPGAMYREFERGVVLANPSPRPCTFDLDSLFSGAPLKRLQGSANQDPETNNGAPVAGQLELAAKDALFLVKGE
jgi:hypothetical protein